MTIKLFFLGAVALVALSLQGCATPKHGMSRLEVLQLLVEIDQRDQNGIKPVEKSDLLRGELALEKMRSHVNESSYQKCTEDYRDLSMENAALRSSNEFLQKILKARKGL